MSGLLFPKLPVNIGLIVQRRALRVFPAETWLTVYRRRVVWIAKISDLNMYSILFSRFPWNGKFILAIIIFRWFFILRRFCKV